MTEMFSTGRSPQNIEMLIPHVDSISRLRKYYTRTSPAAFIVYLTPGLDVFDEVDYSVGITVLIVVPCDKFHELFVQWDASLGIKYR